MVDISDLKVGDEIKIVDKWNACSNECVSMDKYLGQTLTVREVHNGYVKVFEDIDDNSTGGWIWVPYAIDRVVSSEESNFNISKEEDVLNLLGL